MSEQAHPEFARHRVSKDEMTLEYRSAGFWKRGPAIVKRHECAVTSAFSAVYPRDIEVGAVPVNGMPGVCHAAVAGSVYGQPPKIQA